MPLSHGRGGDQRRSCPTRRIGISVFELFAQPLVQRSERFGALLKRPGLDVGQLRGENSRVWFGYDGLGVHTV